MSPELHPDARARFDELATDLLSRADDQPPPQREPENRFRANTYIPNQVTPIGPRIEECVDLTGAEGFLTFSDAAGFVTVRGESYVALQRLAEKLQATAALNNVVSVKFVRNLIFEWIRGKRRGTIETALTEHLLAGATAAIEEQEVWIPVSFLLIESDFTIGRITFKTFTEDFFKKWLDLEKPTTESDRAALKGWHEKQRKKLQGFAAATLTVFAERERALEIAVEQAEIAVGILRLYHDANRHADDVCWCEPRIVSMPARQAFFMNDGKLDIAEEGFVVRPGGVPLWLIRDDDLKDFRVLGLDEYGKIASLSKKTPFQQFAIDAVLLYTTGALKIDLGDRLVYQFAGLESLLVANDGEPLLQNISERMAFAIGKSPSERVAIVGAVKDVYGLRSGFVHHGRHVRDLEIFEAYARYGWIFFTQLSSNLHFQTKQQFIEAIDRIKFGGGSTQPGRSA